MLTKGGCQKRRGARASRLMKQQLEKPLLPCHADASLHQSFDFEWHTLSFCLPNKLAVDVKDAHLNEVFDIQIPKAFIAHLSNELRTDLENAHFYKTLKGLFIKTHLSYLRNEVCVYLENARFNQILHSEVRKARRFHLAHEPRIDLEDRSLEQIINSQ